MESLLLPESVERSNGSSALQDSLRARRQLDALLTFVKEQTQLRATDWGIGGTNSTANRVASDELDIKQQSLSDTNRFVSPPSPKTFPGSEPARKSATRSQGSIPSEANSRRRRKCTVSTDNFVLVPETLSVCREASLLYSRACSLVLEGLDSDGVLLLDAPRGQSRNSSRRASCIDPTEFDSGAEPASPHHRSSSLPFQGEWLEKQGELLGSACSESHHIDAHEPASRFTQELLRNLLALFPDGEIFNSSYFTRTTAEVNETVPGDLKKIFPEATSVIFQPLWDTDKSRWIAALVIWTSRDHFTQHDLDYIRAFGGTIVSELAQVERAATNKSKYDFLSSVSHELRSPLHGMLANSELLQSTNLDRTQLDMVEMIKTCGNTLLNTMNHLLDFAKINNLTNSHNTPINNATQFDALMSNVDIDKLIEDVTEVLYAGHVSRIDIADVAGLHFSAGSRPPSQLALDDDLSVIVRVEDGRSWNIQSIPGAWRRIIMNVVGNALKFTRSGLIDVSLSQTEIHDNSSTASYAEIKVTDTGCGISKEYLQNYMFTPFSQEQVLTEGVGLGLCIAHKLVTHLGGQIEISSKIGTGTEVSIRIPIMFANEEQAVGNSGANESYTYPPKKVSLVDLNLSGLQEEDQRLLRPETKRKSAVRDVLRGALSNQQRWEVSFADNLTHGPPGDIAVLEQSTLEKLAITGPIKSTFRSVVVLRSHNIPASKDLEFAGVVNVAYVSQPFGPRKILRALEQVAEPGGLTLRSLRDDTSRGHSIPTPTPSSSDSPPAVRNSVSEFPTPDPVSIQGGLHVLIVDDNDINLKVLSTFMSKIGCSYDTASNGLVAVEKYRETQQKFDYVLMDISMPVMDGITASRTIREYEDESLLERCTIMAVTGVASSDMQQQAFAAGMDDYLVKPLSLHDLKRILGVF
ncbi:hypothetical protein BDW71DRAFT_176289 [Aspergillus fruticulosus]